MDKIVLDKKTFEALAIETRVKILKALKERRKTQSELSRELSLAPSTVSEHLEKMLEAGLIAKKKDHHKWIYYELTEKGQHILSPTKASVFVFALSLTLIVVVGIFIAYSSLGSISASGTPSMAAEKMGLGQASPSAQEIGLSSEMVFFLIIIVAIMLILFFYLRQRARK